VDREYILNRPLKDNMSKSRYLLGYVGIQVFPAGWSKGAKRLFWDIAIGEFACTHYIYRILQVASAAWPPSLATWRS
jgi:hypothetical protein